MHTSINPHSSDALEARIEHSSPAPLPIYETPTPHHACACFRSGVMARTWDGEEPASGREKKPGGGFVGWDSGMETDCAGLAGWITRCAYCDLGGADEEEERAVM